MEDPTPPRAAGEVWGMFPQDPRDPACARMRASDADRDRVQGVLAEAFSDGRLDRDEYDERSSTALGARTLGQLPPLLVDLLPERPVSRSPGTVQLVDASAPELQRRAVLRFTEERRNAVLAFLGPTLVCWAIWVFTSLGPGGFDPSFPWPLLPTFFTAMNLVRVVAGRRQIEARELQSLERRQAKALRAREKRSGPA